MDPLLAAIDDRFAGLLARIVRGEDVPPGQSLRLEGLLEAAVLSGLATPEALDRRLATAYEGTMGASIEEKLGDNWRELMPFPGLPLFMNRAPVSPSTPD